MVTHELALACADVLALYCSEHWDPDTGECHNCIYENKRCRLHLFLGFFGKELKDQVDAEVRTKCNQLRGQNNG